MINQRRPLKFLNLSIDSSKCRTHSSKLSHTLQSSSRITDEERLLFENTQLQFQIHQQEKEFKMYKIKQNQCQPMIGLNVDSTQQKSNLKKLQLYIKQLESELLQKYKIIEDMKKQMTFTKFQELKIEALSFQQECSRLQKKISKLTSFLNLKNYGIDLFKNYENLKIQNKNLENTHQIQQSLIDQLQNQLQMYKQQIEQLKLQNKHLQMENTRVLQLLNQNITPKQSKNFNNNQCLQEDIEIAKLQVKIIQLQNQMINYQNKKEKQIQELLSIIMDKEDQIQTYQTQKAVIKEVSQPDQQILDTKYQQCIQHIKSEKSILEDIYLDVPPQLNLMKQVSIRKKQNVQDTQKSQYFELGNIIDIEVYSKDIDFNDLIQNEYKTQRLPKVNYLEVELIGKKLKCQLQMKMIPLSYMDQIFDYGDDGSQEITVEELILILSAEPFMMVEEKERILVARYLIEDNTEDYILFNQLNSNSVSIIKSVLKQLLGKYQLFSKQEKQNLEQQLKSIFLKAHYKLIDSIQQQNIKNNNQKIDQCSLTDFERILKSCEIALQPRQIEYIYFINFSLCKQIENIRYCDLIEYFCNVQFQ
ncbi:unnamed protein product [Paramecium sonneborni]|uniref:Uncharacterized protein n=1 Tax=Paramecium sonneborni TaxID=65129 RepID=A0A8S1R0V6_9CILI|nr:unnamed protein product [Paramecium sonneborni]